MKNKWLKRTVTAFLVLAIAVVGAVKFPLIWREVTFHWTEHTDAELQVKAYADEMGVSLSTVKRIKSGETKVEGYSFPIR